MKIPYERGIECIYAWPTQAGYEGSELRAETRIHLWIPAGGSADNSQNIWQSLDLTLLPVVQILSCC